MASQQDASQPQERTMSRYGVSRKVILRVVPADDRTYRRTGVLVQDSDIAYEARAGRQISILAHNRGQLAPIPCDECASSNRSSRFTDCVVFPGFSKCTNCHYACQTGRRCSLGPFMIGRREFDAHGNPAPVYLQPTGVARLDMVVKDTDADSYPKFLSWVHEISYDVQEPCPECKDEGFGPFPECRILPGALIMCTNCAAADEPRACSFTPYLFIVEPMEMREDAIDEPSAPSASAPSASAPSASAPSTSASQQNGSAENAESAEPTPDDDSRWAAR
ncbi:hypothetical protein B7494_g1970 [Chlorociboria aeruginascens]|nr:hypothetical protein B7494_g1970 [Chlorociboria aeruginascens]